MKPSSTDFLLELIEHTLVSTEDDGLSLWSEVFDQYIACWDIPNCRRMLRIIKRSRSSSKSENEVQVIGLSAQGMFEIYLGNSLEAIDCYKKALARINNTNGEKVTEAWLWSNLGNIYYLSGQFKEATESYSHSIEFYREAGDEKGVELSLSNQGNVFRDIGELEKAIDCYQQALAWQKAHGEDEYSAVTLVNLGSVFQLQEAYEEAETAYRQALEIFTSLGNLHYQAQTLGNLGTLFLETNRLDAALESFSQDLEANQKAGDLISQSQALNNLAIVYRRKQNPTQARFYYEESLKTKREIGDRQGELSTLINYCYLLQDIGDRENLQKSLTKARTLAVSLNDGERLTRVEALEREVLQR